MIDFFQMVLSGIAVGSSYALMGLAMVIIYKTSEVPNFAQGEMALLTAFITFMALETYGLPYHVAFPLAVMTAFLIGCILEFAVLRRAKEPNILGFITITIGIEMVLLGLVSWKFGADHKTLPFPIGPYDAMILGDLFISSLEALTFAVTLVLMVVLFFFFRFSKLGLAMKATQQNLNAARLMGIRTNRILMVTWGISSVVGATAGLLIAPTIMHPYMMWDPMLKGFAAAVLGGMTSLPGAVVAFAVIVIILCIKPSGLFARHYVKKV